ncbi:hypothetical protein [Microbacterium sp. BK668]|uniref:hypothetical protein n=1 Tax=Microbacterium sp. BK668 TaxID=2512118 RepID=UPI00105B42F2|nr:hypothetical protein [Microbacterium sp. BK668]TDN91811.1 hypothetical protein EV279_1316 [Microbacterium sp. BK668]
MSTTGNENEQPGVNYPDRGDGDGAMGTPGGGDAVRGDQRRMEGEAAGEVPQQREVENPEQAAAVPGAGAAEEGWSGSFPPPGEASDGVASGGGSDASSSGGGSDASSSGGGAHSAATDDAKGNPPSGEPSHEAVGIGVIDDGTSDPAARAAGTPGGQSQAGQDGPTYGGQADAGHHGQDGGRDTMTASQAQKENALGTAQEQSLPAMSQNNASDVEKISGIVVQTRDDMAATQPERVYDVLKQRLEQAGIDLPDSEIQELARQITTGDA